MTWYLEGFDKNSKKILRETVRTLPFAVGRRSSCELSLPSKMVSQQHAELFERDGTVWIRDLGSTNGTFVNTQRLEDERKLEDGDVLHFADLEFRLIQGQAEDASWPSLTKTMNLKDVDVLGSGVGRSRELREILDQGALRALYQPLVRLHDGALLGYEALGRGTLEGAPSSPGDLFFTAETVGLASKLSVALRAKGVEHARRLPEPKRIFLNTHPDELGNHAALIASLQPYYDDPPGFKIVLEIHESAVADGAGLQGLRQDLDALGVEIAFDDFGTGQARLVELTDAAPHYLKFDAVFIKNIHLASPQRRDMVRTLVKMVVDMGIVSIAEGVECREEAEVCAELGLEYGQGYYFSRPAPPESFREDSDYTEVPA